VQFELLILVSFSSLPNLQFAFTEVGTNEPDGKQLDVLFVLTTFLQKVKFACVVHIVTL